MLEHNLTPDQIQVVENLVYEGLIAEAWQVLYFHGDSYADNAAAVIGLPNAGTSQIG